MSRHLGIVGSSPTGPTIKVRPASMIANFRPGMELQLRTPEFVRAGTALVQDVDPVASTLTFASNVNVCVVAAAEGDEIIEYEVECTRCRCKACEALR